MNRIARLPHGSSARSSEVSFGLEDARYGSRLKFYGWDYENTGLSDAEREFSWASGPEARRDFVRPFRGPRRWTGEEA
jgi:hypothetical protein